MEKQPSLKQMEDFVSEIRGKGFVDGFALQSIYGVQDLVKGIQEHFHMSDMDPDRRPRYPFMIINRTMISSPDEPIHIAKFYVDADPCKGLKIKEMEIWREACHEGGVEASYILKITSLDDVPTKNEVNLKLVEHKNRIVNVRKNATGPLKPPRKGLRF